MQIPFRMGSVVRSKVGDFEGEGIIRGVSIDFTIKGIPHFDYATTEGGWYKHRNLELVSEPTEKSLRRLAKCWFED